MYTTSTSNDIKGFQNAQMLTRQVVYKAFHRMTPPPSATPLLHSRSEWRLWSTLSHGSLIPFRVLHLCLLCIVGRLDYAIMFQNHPSHRIFQLIDQTGSTFLFLLGNPH